MYQELFGFNGYEHQEQNLHTGYNVHNIITKSYACCIKPEPAKILREAAAIAN